MNEPENRARRITGRHLILDGSGAIAEVEHRLADHVMTRLRAGLRHLGWSVEPLIRQHRHGCSIALPSAPDLTEIAVDLLDWAIGERGLDDIDDLPARADRMRNPAYRALLNAFPGLVFEGEDLVTVGLGQHARSFKPHALPRPDELGEVRGVPFALVTGTNGKTTTTRLLAHLAAAVGLTAGRTSSDGVVIGEDTVERGDWTGPGATRRVLRDARVQFGALETARGGILRRGLALDGAQAAIVTNVTPEHLGEWGVDDLFTMARAKLVVGEGLARGGTLVVPAESPPIHAALRILLEKRPDIRVRTFSSTRPAHAWCDGPFLRVGDAAIPVGDVPITFDGTARHNVENALAATLAALAMGLPGEAINRGLRTFRPSVADNPGRMNTFRLPSGALAVIDFAHNADGVRRIAETIRRWPKPRRTLLIGQAGDRPNEDLYGMAGAAALLAPHRVIVKDVTARLYDREPGEVPRILRQSLIAHGVPAGIIDVTPDEATGVKLALRGADRDDVIVLLIHETLMSAVDILTAQGAVAI